MGMILLIESFLSSLPFIFSIDLSLVPSNSVGIVAKYGNLPTESMGMILLIESFLTAI